MGIGFSSQQNAARQARLADYSGDWRFCLPLGPSRLPLTPYRSSKVQYEFGRVYRLRASENNKKQGGDPRISSRASCSRDPVNGQTRLAPHLVILPLTPTSDHPFRERFEPDQSK
ncbi:hypothetical protein CSAL01_02047 [Colletotrichum salicis]|uniref:Uncharacterized protein n=1 Tax=Colletotrichum salicis TaxID=1209931 RepID=A0A135TW71_9PEZI|nr:hypothetical protein CSAL01_02047 [Colletotrichum salicis]